MKPIIEVTNLSKKYQIKENLKYESFRDVLANTFSGKKKKSQGDFWALKDISFTVQPGEVLGIIGRNGAGKSTLLKILSQITPPTSGKAILRGRVASLLEVGTGFHPELTGRENIFLNGAILGMTRQEIRKKFDEIVDFAEIEKFLDTPVKHYSSGMYMRLAFSVAAHLDPEILLVDEVLAVGDREFQKKSIEKMDKTSKEGKTILFVSHNLSAIKNLCSRVLLLDKGKIIADDSAHKVISRYTNTSRLKNYSKDWLDERTSPQNESILLKKVRLCDDVFDSLRSVYTDQSCNIEIIFKVKKLTSTVGLTIILYDSQNNCVFSSINNLEKKWYGKTMLKGEYRSMCKIPANFLNNEDYYININMFGKGFSDTYLAQEVLKFTVSDGVSIRGDYYGQFGGVVRPLLTWTTSKL